MTQAIFGLFGVLVGSAITWGIELWRARRRDSDEGRVAARLVIEELQSIDNVRTVDEPEFGRQRELAMKQEAWHSYRAVLARELCNERWRNVRAAYDALSEPQRSAAGGETSMIGTRKRWRRSNRSLPSRAIGGCDSDSAGAGAALTEAQA